MRARILPVAPDIARMLSDDHAALRNVLDALATASGTNDAYLHKEEAMLVITTSPSGLRTRAIFDTPAGRTIVEDRAITLPEGTTSGMPEITIAAMAGRSLSEIVDLGIGGLTDLTDRRIVSVTTSEGRTTLELDVELVEVQLQHHAASCNVSMPSGR